MIIKRKKRERAKDEPFNGAKEVGMRVAIEAKVVAGWKQPLTEKQEAIDGKVPQGQAKGNVKGKELKKETI